MADGSENIKLPNRPLTQTAYGILHDWAVKAGFTAGAQGVIQESMNAVGKSASFAQASHAERVAGTSKLILESFVAEAELFFQHAPEAEDATIATIMLNGLASRIRSGPMAEREIAFDAINGKIAKSVFANALRLGLVKRIFITGKTEDFSQAVQKLSADHKRFLLHYGVMTLRSFTQLQNTEILNQQRLLGMAEKAACLQGIDPVLDEQFDLALQRADAMHGITYTKPRTVRGKTGERLEH